jgi:Putative addiction module component
MPATRMSMTLDQIVAEAQQLPREQAAELLDQLMADAFGAPDAGIEQAWKTETRRRIAEIESGARFPGRGSHGGVVPHRRPVKRFRFQREALAEAKAAVEHDAAINQQLGQPFYDTIDQLVREVCAQSTFYRLFDLPARRHFRRPFPPAVICPDRSVHVWIVAVAPFKMRPGDW